MSSVESTYAFYLIKKSKVLLKNEDSMKKSECEITNDYPFNT